jgi:hypothetical protein
MTGTIFRRFNELYAFIDGTPLELKNIAKYTPKNQISDGKAGASLGSLIDSRVIAVP